MPEKGIEMNAEQRKDLERGAEIARSWCLGAIDNMKGKRASVVVCFAAPAGDGSGTKGWDGDAVDSLVAMATFCTMLYMDGGHVIDIVIIADDKSVIISREEWEKSVGVAS